MAEEDIRNIVRSASIVDFPAEKRIRDIGETDRELSWFDRNDYGNGQRLIVRHGEDLIYVPGRSWYVWDGSRWRQDIEGMAARTYAHRVAVAIKDEVLTMEFQQIAEKLVTEQGLPHGKAFDIAHRMIDSHKKWATASGNQARTRAMLTEAAPYITVPVKDFDTDDFLITVENGTLELTSKEMEKRSYVKIRPHSRADKMTAMADVSFDVEAKAPHWEAFLATILPDEDLRTFVQRYFGYVLTGDQGEQCLCLFYGGGANGKSTLMDVIADIMGDYSKVLPFASLLHDDRKRGGEATPDLARLPGARYVRASEPDAGMRFSESLIKTVTGGEKITTRTLNKDFFEFRPQFKLVLAFNNRPSIRGGDHGIWRRLMMVPFEVVIPKEQQDPHLKDKLLEEKSGILNWMLDGYRMWREMGLAAPGAVRAATQEYRDEQDPLRIFLTDCVVHDETSSIQATRLYELYGRWCQQNGFDPLKQAMFGRLVAGRGFKKIKAGTFFYENIAFSASAEKLVSTPATYSP